MGFLLGATTTGDIINTPPSLRSLATFEFQDPYEAVGEDDREPAAAASSG